MEIDAWLSAAIADARRRGLPDLEPLLVALARATRQLRATRFDGPSADERSSRDRQPEHDSD